MLSLLCLHSKNYKYSFVIAFFVCACSCQTYSEQFYVVYFRTSGLKCSIDDDNDNCFWSRALITPAPSSNKANI